MSMIGNFLAIPPEKYDYLHKNPTEISSFLYSDEMYASDLWLDVDKAWHGVHFLLTGSTWDGEEPYRSVVLGGEVVGEDVGYGPARFLQIDLVKKINVALAEVDNQILKSRFDPIELTNADIYPGQWRAGDSDYLIGAFEEIKKFYNAAAGRNYCVILYLN